MACLTAEPLAPSEAELERAHEAERARSLAELLDRLSVRLGPRAVTRRELIDAHLPEQAEAAAPAALGEARLRGATPVAMTAGAPARPLRLFARPEPIEALAEVPDGPPLRFRWRRVLHDVAAIEGVTPALLVAVGEKGVKSLDDLADLAADELIEMGAGAGAKLEEDQANAIIMAARQHWFDNEPAAAEKPAAGE